MTSALSRLLVTVENYPNLKANQGFQDLRAQLEGTENRIGIARNRYIKSVEDYNVFIRQLPQNLTAMVFGYKQRPAVLGRERSGDQQAADRRLRHARSRRRGCGAWRARAPRCWSPPRACSRRASSRRRPRLNCRRDSSRPRLPGQAPSTGTPPRRFRLRATRARRRRTPGEAAMPTLPDGRLAVPPLARVTDTAGVLGGGAKDRLEAKLAAFEQSKGSQIAVIVVPSTQPEPISDFTNRVGDAWKIGRKGVGDGVLIAVAVKDRRVWISVARALEGAIPDVVATRITRELMGPQFARGDFAAGIDAGVDAVMKRIEGEALPTPAGVPRHKVDAGEDLLAALVPLIIFGTLVGALLRRIFGVPGAMVSGAGTGAIAGFMLSSLIVGAIAGIAVLVLSGFGGGRGPLGGGRVLGGRRGGPVIIPGGWSGGGGWGGGGGGGGGWSSGGGGDFSGGGGGSSW